MVDSYPLAASLTLFANILQNPRDPQALSDIELMKSVTTFLSGFFDDKTFPESDFVVKVFLEVNRRAAQHVEKARMQGTQVLKRARSETIPIPSGSVENSELINPATPATPASVLQVCGDSSSVCGQLSNHALEQCKPTPFSISYSVH
jgi:hypothetical protein